MSIISYLKEIKIVLEKLVQKEGEEWIDRMYLFISEGPCKEALADFLDCLGEADKKKESGGHCVTILHKYMEAHANYYQPLLAMEKAAEEVLMKALMPSTVSLNEKELEQEDERIRAFMRGGGCKESYMVWQDCIYTEKVEKNKHGFDIECSEHYARLAKCMDAHSHYYQPVLAAMKITKDHFMNKLKAFFRGMS